MEELPRDSFLEFNENTLQEVRRTFKLDKPGELEDVVNILEAWVKEQPHFTKTNFERRYLETTIIGSKGSIELAKSRIDRGCTIRTLMPHNFGICDVRYIYKTDLNIMVHSPLPKMTKNNERVYIMRMVGTEKFSDTSMDNFMKSLPFLGEYLRFNDYAESYILVLDYTEANLMDCARVLTLNLVQEIVAYLLDCCAFRVKGIYFISSSKLISVIVSVFKQVLSAKLAERIHILKDKEAAAEYFDKEILPKEYGGSEMSLVDLKAKWMDAVSTEEHVQYMKEINSARTDESRRQSSKFNDEYMGMPGSFRKLAVD
ncbi:CRAL/TRIO domain-containing protein [Phthorimaea operculella]|nr:CRAL/TRIO domain-containing protein [Phthorimaea operculella]